MRRGPAYCLPDEKPNERSRTLATLRRRVAKRSLLPSFRGPTAQLSQKSLSQRTVIVMTVPNHRDGTPRLVFRNRSINKSTAPVRATSHVGQERDSLP